MKKSKLFMEFTALDGTIYYMKEGYITGFHEQTVGNRRETLVDVLGGAHYRVTETPEEIVAKFTETYREKGWL